MITAITTCMGRREHLEATLPYMLDAFEHVIVVDWSCPQKSGEWAAKQGAQVVYQRDEQYFNVAKARNIGAQKCATRKACFVDADTIVFQGIAEEVESLISLRTIAIAPRTSADRDFPSLYGFLGVDLGLFWSVKGYNEEFEGYGIEDQYMRAALVCDAGVSAARVSGQYLSSIRHTNEMRSRHYRDSIEVSNSRNYQILVKYLESRGITDWFNDPRTKDVAYRAIRDEDLCQHW